MRNILETTIFTLLMVAAVARADVKPPNGELSGPNPLDSAQVVGTLPYSNQWVYDRAGNYFYINGDRNFLANQGASVSHFQIDFNSRQLNTFSADFFSRFTFLAPAMSKSFLKNFALWGRYRLGYGAVDGQVTDVSVNEVLSSERTSLNVLSGQVALVLGYEALTWFKPFIGFGYQPYFYRTTSTMSSVETQGQSAMYGPTIGAHFPVLFGGTGSLFAELHDNVAPGDGDQIFASSVAGDFGVGFAF